MKTAVQTFLCKGKCKHCPREPQSTPYRVVSSSRERREDSRGTTAAVASHPASTRKGVVESCQDTSEKGRWKEIYINLHADMMEGGEEIFCSVSVREMIQGSSTFASSRMRLPPFGWGVWADSTDS